MSEYDLQKYLNSLANELEAENLARMEMNNRATQSQNYYLYYKEADITRKRPKSRGPSPLTRRHVDKDSGYQSVFKKRKKSEQLDIHVPAPGFVEDTDIAKEAWYLSVKKAFDEGKLFYKQMPNYPVITDNYKHALKEMGVKNPDNYLAIKLARFMRGL